MALRVQPTLSSHSPRSILPPAPVFRIHCLSYRERGRALVDEAKQTCLGVPVSHKRHLDKRMIDSRATVETGLYNDGGRRHSRAPRVGQDGRLSQRTTPKSFPRLSRRHRRL
ncbi:hypothetical protein B0T16DRAFT_186818 [Cercophora newfieldiana]|uniref:Uncharacterized protein n=1 Tax=Cercophora newfieldiana TaxID=92897 RepID=A0AA39Y1Y5_9PEZI|nr:hypothetical protein B0T16DRAFT_186818 [Cercophora newfieldiana]